MNKNYIELRLLIYATRVYNLIADNHYVQPHVYKECGCPDFDTSEYE